MRSENATVDAEFERWNPGAIAGDFVVFSVADNGVGMKEDVLANAFEPCFTTKKVGEGTGLGLSMVYGFAQQSGGHARISSTLGEGTTVSLYLPRAEMKKGPTAQVA